MFISSPLEGSKEARNIDTVEILCIKAANYIHFPAEHWQKYPWYGKNLQEKVV